MARGCGALHNNTTGPPARVRFTHFLLQQSLSKSHFTSAPPQVVEQLPPAQNRPEQQRLDELESQATPPVEHWLTHLPSQQVAGLQQSASALHPGWPLTLA